MGLGVASRLSTAGLTPFLLPPSLPIHPPSLLPSTSPPARLPQLTPWLTFLDTLPLPQVLTLTKLPPANTSLDSPLTDISSTPWLPLFDTPPIHKKTSQIYPPNLFFPLSFYPPNLCFPSLPIFSPWKDTLPIHPKKDNVCGIQFFSPKKSAEKVRTF